MALDSGEALSSLKITLVMSPGLSLGLRDINIFNRKIAESGRREIPDVYKYGESRHVSLQPSSTPAASVLIPPLADLHMILQRLRAIWCRYLIMSEWSNGKQHSQSLPSDLCPVLAELERKRCLSSWQLNNQLCVSLKCVFVWIYSSRKCDCVSSGR